MKTIETQTHPMSLQIIEISFKLSAYGNRLVKMSINNISKFETAMKENEYLLKNNIKNSKTKAYSSISKTVYPLNPKNCPSY